MIDSNIVKEFVEANPKLVSRKPTSIDGVYLLKYKPNVFYDNLWNEILQECRGTLVDEDYQVIARPFTKIFNHMENGTTIDPDEYCIAYKKINGFMASISYYNEKLVISTTGSTDSPFVGLAKEMIEKYCDDYNIMSYLGRMKTVIVEIVHPDDPHIVPEEEGVYLLGARWNSWLAGPNMFLYDDRLHYQDTAKQFGMKQCDYINSKFSDICTLAKMAKHEGYVVYGQKSWTSLKIKSPYYLMSKFLARKNEQKLIRLIDNPHEIKKIVDEEFYNVVDIVCANKKLFISKNEQERLDFIRNIL